MVIHNLFAGKLPDGTIQAELDTGCIPQSVLQEIWLLRRQEIDFKDIVERLRPRTVPTGYTYHNWTPGMVANVYIYDHV